MFFKKFIIIALVSIVIGRMVDLKNTIDNLEEEIKCKTCSHCSRNGSSDRCIATGSGLANDCTYLYTKHVSGEGLSSVWECATGTATKRTYCQDRCKWEHGSCVRDAICSVNDNTSEV
jgi:hypothetical protein